MTRLFCVYIVIALLTVFANTASAAFVDFSSSEFEEANGEQTFETTANDVGMTITVEPNDATIYWDSEDGLGVDSPVWWDEEDEIDNCEKLTVTFDDGVYLASASLTDLFYEYGYREMGYYVLSDGTVEYFKADLSQVSNTNGELTVDIGADNITSVTFLAAKGFFNEYSVKGIDFTLRGNASVPELDAGSSASALALLFGCVFVVNGRRKLTL